MYQIMTSCVSCLVLWMLLCGVKAEITNFADTPTIPDITPMAEMASRSASVGECASGDGADALGGAFHQLAQRLLRVQSSASATSPNSTSPTASPSPSPSSSQSLSPSLTIPTSSSTSSPNTTFSTNPRLPAACDEECEKQRVQLRTSEVKERARAALSPLGKLLITASINGTLEDVRLLLDAGADVNTVDSDGITPLMYSVSLSEVVSLLLQRGAIVNAVDVDGWTALHWAAWKDSNGRVVSLLLREGAVVDARDVAGLTPLHWAAFENNEAAVRALLEGGARKDLRAWSVRVDWKSKTPFDLATSDIIRNLLRP